VKFAKIKISLAIFFVSLGVINIPSISFAEMQIEVQESEINVETSPSSPRPYQDVTISLSSYATDLNKAFITWQGETGTVLSGIGEKSYTFKAPGPNDVSSFNVSISPAGGMSSITKKIIIAPSEIEIMWESVDGYTPPFYRGKSLPASGSLIRAVAIPNTNTIKSGSGSLTYTWKNAGKTILDASGYNKNSYTFKNSMFDNSNSITVTSSSVAGSYGSTNTIEIPMYKPKLIFYEVSPSEGILYNKALNREASFSLDEVSIVAEPYFLSLKGKSDNFSYSWKINGKDVSTPSKKTELTVRPTSHGGYATINLLIENMSELYQEVNNSLKLNL